MNEKRRALVINWIIDYIMLCVLYGSMYFFNDSMLPYIAVIMIVPLLRGKADKQTKEKAMAEFIKYSKQHMAILAAFAVYSVLMPIVIYFSIKTNYIKIETNSKSFPFIAPFFLIPLVILDIGYRLNTYKKYEKTTEQNFPAAR